MTDTMSKQVKIGEWIFEVKMVRALKVDEEGQPYSSIANFNINGDSMYIDGLLTNEQENLTKEDFDTFTEFSKLMGLKQMSYHRYQNGQSVAKTITVAPTNETSTPTTEKTIRLVK